MFRRENSLTTFSAQIADNADHQFSGHSQKKSFFQACSENKKKSEIRKGVQL
jgi:hypothetical protein